MVFLTVLRPKKDGNEKIYVAAFLLDVDKCRAAFSMPFFLNFRTVSLIYEGFRGNM